LNIEFLPSSFLSYNQLTENIIVEWVQNKLGQEIRL
jgi:hypothetical protein